jgi:hypothetical protein
MKPKNDFTEGPKALSGLTKALPLFLLEGAVK